MRLLDLFCGAGGAAAGYRRAGFTEIVGVDNRPQKNYPFKFVQADALEYCREHGPRGDNSIARFDVIHASPPCQRYSKMQQIHNNREEHPDLIAPTRALLLQVGRPYVIENVVGAPLLTHCLLCGTMFGLPIQHHRLFECSFELPLLMPACQHNNTYDHFHGGEQARGEREKLSSAMGIDWFMTRPEVRNAIPPAFTQWIGERLLVHLHDGNRPDDCAT